jgi:hypothetical protein
MGVRKKAICIISNSRELFLSFRRALKLSFPNASFSFYDTITTNNQFYLPLVRGANFRSNLLKYRLIIAVAHWDAKPLEIIRFVHHLRSDLAWEGSFLAIVNKELEKQRLREINLIGERAERFRFGQLPGHAVIYLPFLLTDFLDEVAKLEDMYIEVWDSLVSGSLVGDISKGINEASEFARNNDKQKALDILREILFKMKQVDWLTWLRDPHEDLVFVNKFIEMYPPEPPVDKNDCSSIITNIQEILSKSFIRI